MLIELSNLTSIQGMYEYMKTGRTIQATLKYKLNIECLHPVARVRSGDFFCIRQRNVTIVG
jgi:hypothetical protein